MRKAAFPRFSMTLARKLAQGGSLLAFLLLFVLTIFTNPLPGLSDLFYRLDPLTALTAMLAGRAFIAGLALAGITLALTVVFGRAWCGWICPMGTTLDLVSPRRSIKNKKAPISARWRLVKYLLLLFILAGALFASQTFLFLDPITVLTRTLAGAIWPALDYAVSQVEAFLYQFEFLWPTLDAVHAAVVYPLFQDVHPVYWMAVPLLAFFVGIVALNWVAERFWCRYLCPLGGLLGLVSRLAIFRRGVSESCTSCGLCARRCPTGAVRAESQFASDPAECTLCFECVKVCPKQSNPIRPALNGWKPAPAQGYDPKRREALGIMSAAVAWAAISGVEPIRTREGAMLIRPPGAKLPGAKDLNFETLCIRCNECVKVCATQGLQPSFLEGGWQNLLTPRLEPRLGPCSYNCNACGQVCPSGAIPNLTLEQKRVTPIGLARVDRTRCLPWAYNIACIVCEESCPLPKKAVKLETAEVVNAAGAQVTIQRPYVIKELCIGCGVCEHQCPMGGDAAIRVFAYSVPGGYFGDDPNFGS